MAARAAATKDNKGDASPMAGEQVDKPVARATRTLNSSAAIETITADEVAAMKARGFTALCICGPGKPVPRGLGDNVGVNPVVVILNSSFKDSVSAPLDRASATYPQGMLFRIWLASKADAKRLENELPALLSQNGSATRSAWFDIGRDADFDALHCAILDLAKDMGLQTYSDSQVLQIARGFAAQTKAANS